jgi:hypothetical protein
VTGIAGDIMMITAMVTGPAARFTGLAKPITVAVLMTVIVMQFKWIRRLHHRNVAAAAAASAAAAAAAAVVVVVAAAAEVTLVREVQCPPGVLTGSAVTAAETAVTGIAGNIMMITAMVTGPAAGFTGPIKAITVAALRTPVTVMRFMWISQLNHRNAAAAAAAAAAAPAAAVGVVALSVQSRPPRSRLQTREGKLIAMAMTLTIATISLTIMVLQNASSAPAPSPCLTTMP